MTFCTNCGKNIDARDSYCINCGVSLPQVDVTTYQRKNHPKRRSVAVPIIIKY